MATFTGNQVTNAPAKHNFHGVVHAAVGEISVDANPADGDIYTLVTLPAGALVLDAEFWIDDLDTGTETLDIDFGWASNGGGSETYTASDGTTYTNAFGTADPNGFVTSGVLTGDATTDQPVIASGAGSYRRSGAFTDGYLYASRETTVQAEANAAANSFAAGKISCRIDYVIVRF